MQRQILILLFAILLVSLMLPYAISNIIFGVLFAYSFYYSLSNKIKPQFSYIHWPWIILYLIMILSLFWSIDFETTKEALFPNLRILVIPLLFSLLPKFSTEEKQHIFSVFSRGMVIFSLGLLLRAVIRFSNLNVPSLFTHYQLVDFWGLNRVEVSVFLAIALFFFIIHFNYKLKTLLMVMILGLMILLLSSKTVVITTILISGVLIWLKLQSKKQKTYFLVLIIPFVFLIIFLSNHLINKQFISEMKPRISEILHFDHFGQNYYLNGAELRILNTRFMWENLNNDHAWWTGYGLKASQIKIDEKIEEYDLYNGYKNYHAHNQFVRYILDLGILGGVIIMYIFILGFKMIWRHGDLFSLAFLVLFFLYFMTDAALYTQRITYLFISIYFILFHRRIIRY